MVTNRLSGRGVWWGMVAIALLGCSLNAQAADEITPIGKILSNPSAFHRHEVVLKGELKLLGQSDWRDSFGRPICGPIFMLEDDTSEMPVIYSIRCDPDEVNKISAMAGGRVIVYATVEADTASRETSGIEFKTRALAKKIRREDK